MRTQVTLLALALVAACQDTGEEPSPPPPERPGAVIETDASRAPPLRFGSPFSADFARLGSLAFTGASLAHVRFHVLTAKPRLPLAGSLDHRVRFAIDETTGEPLLTPQLAEGAVLLDAESVDGHAFDASDLAGDEIVALPEGVSVRVALASSRPETARILTGVATPVVRRELALLLRRSEEQHELDVALELAADGKRELLDLHPLRLTPAVGVLVPSPLGDRGDWIVALVFVSPAPRPGDPGAAAYERSLLAIRSSLDAERARVASRASAPSSPPSSAVREDESEDAALLLMDEWPRRGIAVLASETGAGIALDAALGTRDPVLQDVTSSIERALRRRRASRLAAASLGDVMLVSVGTFHTLAWELDLATLEALLSGANRGDARSLLERRYGAAFDGDLGGTSRPLLPRARMFRGEAQLDRVVLVRNLLALEDTRPGIRFVAGRWLQPRAPGLAGYDPFAPFEERRRAVDRLWQRLVPEESP